MSDIDPSLSASASAQGSINREENRSSTGPDAASGPVVIVSAHGLVRQGLRRLAEVHSSNVLAFSTFDELKAAFPDGAPRSVLLFEPIPHTEISKQAEEISRHSPNWHLVLLVNDLAEVDMGACIRAGARGCLTQETPDEMVGRLLDIFSAGNIVWPAVPKVGDGFNCRVTDRLSQAHTQHPADLRQKLALLSKREKEVLGYIGNGLGNKRIASKMGISDTTVRLHMRSILRKLGVENRTQIAILAQNSQIDRS